MWSPLCPMRQLTSTRDENATAELCPAKDTRSGESIFGLSKVRRRLKNSFNPSYTLALTRSLNRSYLNRRKHENTYSVRDDFAFIN